jgi:hypothetical protein
MDVKWKIIFFHKPFYTIGTHYGEMDTYFDTWLKAFDDYGVDFVVNGHVTCTNVQNQLET